MNNPEIKIDNNTYRIGNMDTRVQFHVARRLSPLFMALTDAMTGIQKGLPIEVWLVQVFGPVTDVISKLPDEQLDYVITACLGVVQRQEADNKWAPIMRGGQMMYADVHMNNMLKLTMAVVKEVLGPFLPEVLGALESPNA